MSEDEIVFPEGYGPARIPGHPGRPAKPVVIQEPEPIEADPLDSPMFSDRQKPIGNIILYPETPEQEAERLARAPIELLSLKAGYSD